MVADLSALDKLGRDGRHHDIAAARATRRSGEGADCGELRSVFMKLHITASFLTSPINLRDSVAPWQSRDGLMKL